MPLAKDVDVDSLAGKTEGYSGADIEAVCREAGINALREKMDSKQVKLKHFKQAMEKIKPSITAKDMKIYKGFLEQFKKPSIEVPKNISYMG